MCLYACVCVHVCVCLCVFCKGFYSCAYTACKYQLLFLATRVCFILWYLINSQWVDYKPFFFMLDYWMCFGHKASYLVSQSFFSLQCKHLLHWKNIEPSSYWLWHPVQYNTVPAKALLYSLYRTRLKPCMGGLIQISQRVFWPRPPAKL